MRGRILRLLLSMTAVFLLSACTGPEKEADSRAERFDTRTEQFLKYARQYGLIESDEYSDLEAQLEKENEQRERAVEQGRVIYGPTRYTMETYIKYICGSMEPLLIEKMKGKELAYTEEDVRSYYEENKEHIAVQEAAMQFEVVIASRENKGLLKKISKEEAAIECAELSTDVFTVSEMEFQENSVVYNRNQEMMEHLFGGGVEPEDRYLTEDTEGSAYLYVCKGKKKAAFSLMSK